MKSQKLSVSNFEGPFSTHGFSLYNPPGDPKTVYIFAINHLPNPLWTAGSATEPKAASRVELFVHTVGSQTATHLRSISHPLIKTPNDLLALSENEFLVTNDHCAQEGVMRILEEVFHEFVSWTNLVHVRFDEQGNVDATISTDSIATNNGLGWGPNQQVLISDAFGGKIYFASQPDQVNRTVAISHHAQLESIVDNPSYFADPWAGLNGRDYSGYVLAGVARPLEFLAGYKDPTGKAPLSSMVWFLPSIAGRDKALAREKLAKLVFSDKGEDDFRGSTTALIVPIDPSSNAGKREGWLFVTGLITPAILATRIDFESALV
ncbi:hypothetical protein F4778DRAFT_716016 [Xylariomycetidae sp. FL2044]|nr:hypothetical protein F4778DRAFT_716016 [Xylariomycetidae sp. FL2044]